MLRSCLVTVFVFSFHFLVFKEKSFFFFFQNEKHVWLVEKKKNIFCHTVLSSKIYGSRVILWLEVIYGDTGTQIHMKHKKYPFDNIN